MRTQDTAPRRDRGDGSLFKRPNAKGGETWIGKWRIDGRAVMRSVGPVRSKVQPDGLTKPQAEAEFRRLRSATKPSPETSGRRTIKEAGASLMEQMRLAGRRPATLEGMESTLRIHMVPFFGARRVDQIAKEDVLNFSKALHDKGLSPKSIRNILVNLNAVIEHAIDSGWIATGQNPVKRVPKPRKAEADGDLRFLRLEEVEALLRVVPETEIGRVDRVMYLTAAMTGLRQGELFALRWRDIDWAASKIRVQQNFVRGQFQSPKSKKPRTVPLADRVAGELQRLFDSTPNQADDDLVFAHPGTGWVMDRSKVAKRFKAAVGRAGVGGFEPVIDSKTGRPKIDAKGQPVMRPIIRFHDLRHTFATTLARSGQATMQDIQNWMGHADLKTTLVYSHYQPSGREAAMIESAFATDAVEQTERAAA